MIALEILIVATYFILGVPITVSVQMRPVPYETLEQCRDAVPRAKALIATEVATLAVEQGYTYEEHSITWRCHDSPLPMQS